MSETPERGPDGLYSRYEKVHPRTVSGPFRRIKDWGLVALLGLYFALPWLRWDRGPDAPNQAVLADMASRRAYIFDLEFWPQEIYYLTVLLVLGAVGLFLVTSLFGRVWCGFTCIQTVFTDLFVKIEALFEGKDRNARIRLEKAPWSWSKFTRKLGKWCVWLLVSIATGAGWVFYFNDAPTTARALIAGDASVGVYVFTVLVAGFTFVLAGWAREQVCVYMCPWPRFQSAMFDEDTLVVSYERNRGEPRGSAKKGDSFDGRGHCVDCTLCVQVCPTGVDIRNGSQLACIGCALCIDACNSVMNRLGLPKNLVAYDSVVRQAARARGQNAGRRFIRPRTILYFLLFAAIVAGLLFGLSARSRLDVNILHERSPLFVSLSDGSIRNGYTFKVLNMQRNARTFRLSLPYPSIATLRVIGYAEDDVKSVDLPVRGDDVGTFRAYVTLPPTALRDAATKIVFRLEDLTSGETIDADELFAGPVQ